tara:strand:- start:1219 stop:3426 length:2208 start_codon:yes stop_codon:yes gene_type:complete
MAIEFSLDDGSVIEFNPLSDDKIVYSDDPGVYTLDNFITPEECQHIIREAKPRLGHAMVGAGLDPNNMDGTYSTNRTGTNCWFPHNHDPIFARVGERIAQEVGHPFANAEQFQVVHYDVGEEFKDHYDGWDQDGTSEHFHNFKFGGNRLLTALIYLNDVPAGGGTKMTKLNHLIEAKQGRVLVFEDCYKGTNNRHLLSEHCGMPVIRGEKYAVNLWFKECPYEIMYKDFRPGYFDRWTGGDNRVNKYNGGDNGGYNGVDDDSDDDSDDDLPPMEEDLSPASLHPKKTIYMREGVTHKLDAYQSCAFRSFKGRQVGWVKKSAEDVLGYVASLEEYLNISRVFFENIYVVKYSGNHKEFYDAYKQNTASMKAMAKLGQRMMTAVLCVKGPVIYTFGKLEQQYILNEGDCLVYKNVKDGGTERDVEMAHDIQINDGILANIYIRERSETGEVLDMGAGPGESYGSRGGGMDGGRMNDGGGGEATNRATTNKKSHIQSTTIRQLPNYSEMYETVLESIKSGSLTENWTGHDEFTYILRSSWSSVYKAAQDYIKLRVKEVAITTLNIKSFEHTFEKNPVPCVWQCPHVFRVDVFKFLTEYYSGLGLQKRTEGQEYYFAHDELISRMMQFDLLPILETITGEKVIPLSTQVVRYEKGYQKPSTTDKAKYVVSWLIEGVSPLMIHKEAIRNKTYAGEYHMVKEDYKTIDYKENEIVVYRADEYISKRDPVEKSYYGIDFYYG